MSTRLMQIMFALAAAIILIVLAVVVSDGLVGVIGPSYAETRTKTRAVMLATALQAYKGDYGEYPHGTAAEVMHSLRGDNPHHEIYFEATDKEFNEKGELVDFWRTPFRIDLSTVPRARVSSAGKNKVFDGDARGSDDIRSWE